MRICLKHHGFRILLLLTLGLWAGCGSSSDQVFNSTGTPALSPTTEEEFGMVFLGQISGNIEVQVLASDSEQVYGSFLTDDSGQFSIPTGTMLPTEFRLVATSAESVRVERYVEAGEKPYLWLNVPSHLISLTKQARPELSLVEAERLIRQGLNISDEHGLYGTSDHLHSAFSHTLYLARAKAGGGFATFNTELIKAIVAGERYSFRPNSIFANFGNGVSPRDNSGIRPQLAVGELFGKFLFNKVGGLIFDEVFGKVASATGLSFGTSSQYQQIQETLDQIQSELEALTNEVTNGFLAQLIATDQSTLKGILTNLKTANNLLSSQAQDAAIRYPDPPPPQMPPFDHGPAVIPSSTTALLSAFSTVVTSNAIQELSDFLTDTNVNSNLLSLAAKQQSLVLGVSDPPSGLIYYPLRRDDLTDALNQNFNLYSGWTLTLATVLSENGNAGYLPQPFSVSGFNPPASRINKAISDISALYTMLEVAQQSVPENCGTELVLIDSEAGLMWYLPTLLGKYDKAQNGMIDLEVNNWRYPDGVDKPKKVGSSVSKDLNGFSRPSDMRGWRLPEVDELKTLRKRVKGLGGGNNKDKTKKALKALGFTGLQSDHDNYKKFWYNGSVFSDANTGTAFSRFQYYDMDKDEFNSEKSTLLTTQIDPKFTAVYVRTIEGLTDSKNFGDTGDQIDRSYDLGPDSLQFFDVTSEYPEPDADIFTLRLEGWHKGLSKVSDMGSRVEWSLQNQNPPNNVFLSYGFETTSSGAAGRALTKVVFRGPGEVTVQAKARNGKTASITLTATKKPTLTALFVSGQNLAIQAVPTMGQFQQFYCTGYLGSGETVDMTNFVQWDVVPDKTTNPLAPRLDPSQAEFRITGGTRGDLVFGGMALAVATPYARAIYDPAADGNLDDRNFKIDPQYFNDGNRFIEFAQFAVPTP